MLILAAALMVVALFTLGSPNAPPLSQDPVTFDGQAAFATVSTLTTQFSRRAAGSDASNRCAVWLVGALKHLGLQTHIASFAATINGKAVALQNVWGVSKGQSAGTIVLVANRDSPPLSTQGADNNASGVAVLLELARDFATTPHQRTMVFLFTDGDSWGGLGARDFVNESLPPDTAAAIALRDVGGARTTGLSLDGWSASAKWRRRGCGSSPRRRRGAPATCRYGSRARPHRCYAWPCPAAPAARDPSSPPACPP